MRMTHEYNYRYIKYMNVYMYVATDLIPEAILTPNSGAQKHFYFAAALHHSTQKEAGSGWFFMCLKHF